MNRSRYFTADRRRPRCLGPRSRPRFVLFLKAKDSPPACRNQSRLRLRIVITLTFAGDLGTIFSAVSVVANMPSPVTALLAPTLAAGSLFLVHKMGRGLRRRGCGAARMPAVLVTVLAALWLVAGLVAAL